MLIAFLASLTNQIALRFSNKITCHLLSKEHATYYLSIVKSGLQ